MYEQLNYHDLFFIIYLFIELINNKKLIIKNTAHMFSLCNCNRHIANDWPEYSHIYRSGNTIDNYYIYSTNGTLLVACIIR